MLIFCDSGDHTTSTVGSGKWSVARNGDSNPSSYGANGRFGTYPVAYMWQDRWMRKDFGANYAHLIVGCAWYVWGDNLPIMGLWDSGSEQVSLWYDAGGQAFAMRRGATLLGSTMPFNITTAYHFVEWRVKVHDTLGEWEVKVDGTTIGSQTGVDTKATANAFANQLRIGDSGDSYRAAYCDDLYVVEKDSGVGASDFLGDVRVEARFPSGNGTTSGMSGSDGNSTDNYLLVDEKPTATSPNGDTDYVESGSVGTKDTYAMQDVTPASGTIFGVQILPSAKRTDTGARSIASVVRLAGVEADGPNRALGSTYAYLPDIRETKPGGGAFSIADVNAMEVGVKVTV